MFAVVSVEIFAALTNVGGVRGGNTAAVIVARTGHTRRQCLRTMLARITGRTDAVVRSVVPRLASGPVTTQLEFTVVKRKTTLGTSESDGTRTHKATSSLGAYRAVVTRIAHTPSLVLHRVTACHSSETSRTEASETISSRATDASIAARIGAAKIGYLKERVLARTAIEQ